MQKSDWAPKISKYSWIAPPVDAHEKSICQKKRKGYDKYETAYKMLSARKLQI